MVELHLFYSVDCICKDHPKIKALRFISVKFQRFWKIIEQSVLSVLVSADDMLYFQISLSVFSARINSYSHYLWE
jgi:hypothetical protein